MHEKRHHFVEERTKKLQEYSNNSPVNFIEEGSGDTGIITSSISYQYVKEVFPDAPVLKNFHVSSPLETDRKNSKLWSKIYIL